MTIRELLYDRFVECPPLLFALFKARLTIYFLKLQVRHLRRKVGQLRLEVGNLPVGVIEPFAVEGRERDLLDPVEDRQDVALCLPERAK